MTKEEIFATVKEIAAEELDIDEAKIVPDVKIKEDLEADSLDVFEIMNELEDKFDIELDVEDGAETINDVVELVAKQLAAKED
ncbi:acyl carrier protein [Limosilactobacillus mucosae]|uniref:acyl carrier protein n=1 Tax=Limosilactobacillus mucosae TaxID=97478 RepID=UPI00088FF2D2|nr:acyl carrier protein [Limosilactobacillus mucosae]SDN24409.1 acyl carrier protein [Limosilactobacillus mucosae]SEK71007.1 acyl carrier protein [Limosilactobacillus mucosae]SFK07345.1 acyl carrier protein [Limosilactobacillus mucosae]